MQAILDFLRTRLAERSSRVQLIALALLALTATGLVTMEQIDAKAAAFAAALNLVGPLLGVLIPDRKAITPDGVASVLADVIARNPDAAALGVRVSEVDAALARLGIKL